MSTPIIFDVRHGFSRLELLKPDGNTDIEIPARLLGRPDVLQALLLIAAKGGRDYLDRTEIDEEIVVDITDQTVARREVVI